MKSTTLRNGDRPVGQGEDADDLLGDGDRAGVDAGLEEAVGRIEVPDDERVEGGMAVCDRLTAGCGWRSGSATYPV
ncbi:hypothetical protein QFW82_01450 [Streptomyces malaysiensis subsp. malaysiensis]|uniref:hypothetical protein n=1 Tax=Streptomyces malaysiensis TaxID=92644 RepID=UPI0024C08AA4|nr:hypothetical protein [Streptomyces sp. NA07423]WHX15765.1 hypothetical protein QFW82_01450 [Streptomyces sp. NA07423]